MVNITLTIPKELREEIKKHKEVNWSAVARKAMLEHLKRIMIAESIAIKSRLTKKDINELDNLVKKGIARSHAL